MISLAYKISHCLSANRYLELRSAICTVVTLLALALHFLHWRYTFCTGVTLFALVLHLNCTTLGQSESSNFFHVYYYDCDGCYVEPGSFHSISFLDISF